MSVCSADLRAEGKPYPRTCAVHGLARCTPAAARASDLLAAVQAAASGYPDVKVAPSDLLLGVSLSSPGATVCAFEIGEPAFWSVSVYLNGVPASELDALLRRSADVEDLTGAFEQYRRIRALLSSLGIRDGKPVQPSSRRP